MRRVGTMRGQRHRRDDSGSVFLLPDEPPEQTAAVIATARPRESLDDSWSAGAGGCRWAGRAPLHHVPGHHDSFPDGHSSQVFR